MPVPSTNIEPFKRNFLAETSTLFRGHIGLIALIAGRLSDGDVSFLKSGAKKRKL